MASKLLSVAALIALANATGNAVIKNSCGFPIYYKVKGYPGSDQSVKTLSQGSSPMTLPYVQQNAGYSILTSPDQNAVNMEQLVSQLEITPDSSGQQIWYDLSNVNSTTAGACTPVSTYAFAKWGFTLSTNQESGCSSTNNCGATSCPAGLDVCEHAYQYCSNDVNTKNCAEASDVILDLCNSSGSVSSGGSSGGSSAPSSAATSVSTPPVQSFGPPSKAASSQQQTTLATSYAAPSSSQAAASSQTQAPYAPYAGQNGQIQEEEAPSATTEADGSVVTQIEMDVQTVTAVVTATAQPRRRSEHLHRHAHHQH